MAEHVLTGGCHCGAVRYEVTADGGEVADYCHCVQCRKASGAPVTAWVQVAPARFAVTAGAATSFASSAEATRWFCAACGSPLHMTDAVGKSVGVTLGTLDDLVAISPTVHGWYGARVEWFEVADGLPRFLESPPYDL
jgi:hypothetical protein